MTQELYYRFDNGRTSLICNTIFTIDSSSSNMAIAPFEVNVVETLRCPLLLGLNSKILFNSFTIKKLKIKFQKIKREKVALYRGQRTCYQ